MRKQWKQWQTLFSWAPKLLLMVSATMTLKKCLLLGRKAMTELDSILKRRDITLPTKDHIVKATGFPVVMYGCESWTIKKAECWRIHAFQSWCKRRLLRVPWRARRSNQSILKEIKHEQSLEELMLRLKLQYFGYQMQRADSLEKDPDAGKDSVQEEKAAAEDEVVGWHHWLNGHWVWAILRQGSLAWCSPWSHREVMLLSDWTETY